MYQGLDLIPSALATMPRGRNAEGSRRLIALPRPTLSLSAGPTRIALFVSQAQSLIPFLDLRSHKSGLALEDDSGTGDGDLVPFFDLRTLLVQIPAWTKMDTD